MNRPVRFPLVLSLLLVAWSAAAPLAQEAGEDDGWGDDPWAEEPGGAALELSGFFEAAVGGFLDDDPVQPNDASLGELRLRGEASRYFGAVQTSLKADLYTDQAVNDDLAYEFREAVVAFGIHDDVDVRLGRQVLTWGTGDLLFLNDLFPKDWVSFFAGRESSYLKAPSNSLKVSIYKRAFNTDFVWTPVFTPDSFLNGERFSYFSPMAGGIVSAPPELDPVEPPKTLNNGEFALRVHRLFQAYEWALYAYRGFSKQPSAYDAAKQRAAFSPLSAYGASVRGPWLGGIGYAEVAWYDSRDDRSGDDPLIPNSQARALVGHERELITNLNLGLQYYVEAIRHHERLRQALPVEQREFAPEDSRHVVTARLTRRALQDKLVLSLFAFLSPSDEDLYAIPGVSYRVSDHWQWDAGFNVFGGNRSHTFLGQFEENSNAFFRIRYNVTR